MVKAIGGAIEVYRALTRMSPDNAEAFYNLGLASKQKDDFQSAEVDLHQAIALDPNNLIPEC